MWHCMESIFSRPKLITNPKKRLLLTVQFLLHANDMFQACECCHRIPETLIHQNTNRRIVVRFNCYPFPHRKRVLGMQLESCSSSCTFCCLYMYSSMCRRWFPYPQILWKEVAAQHTLCLHLYWLRLPSTPSIAAARNTNNCHLLLILDAENRIPGSRINTSSGVEALLCPHNNADNSTFSRWGLGTWNSSLKNCICFFSRWQNSDLFPWSCFSPETRPQFRCAQQKNQAGSFFWMVQENQDQITCAEDST